MPATLAWWAGELSGPRSVASSPVGPMRTAAIRSATPVTKASYTERCTIARVAAVQSWPALIRDAATAPWMAASRSASSKTTNGALPPSSRCTRLPVAEAVAITWRPTLVEPVNEVIATSGWPTRCWPATGPVPVTTLTTPAGAPASVNASAKIRLR